MGLPSELRPGQVLGLLARVGFGRLKSDLVHSASSPTVAVTFHRRRLAERRPRLLAPVLRKLHLFSALAAQRLVVKDSTKGKYKGHRYGKRNEGPSTFQFCSGGMWWISDGYSAESERAGWTVSIHVYNKT